MAEVNGNPYCRRRVRWWDWSWISKTSRRSCGRLVTAVISDNDFAAQLDRAIERSQMIDVKPPTNGDKPDARLPPRLADRRFRRLW